jgi:hypothetical protein
LFLGNINDGYGVSMNRKEDPEVGAGLQDVDIWDGIKALRMSAHKLIPTPVGKVPERGLNPTAVVVIKRPQSHFNRWRGDDFFHGNLQLSDGDSSRNLLIVPRTRCAGKIAPG